MGLRRDEDPIGLLARAAGRRARTSGWPVVKVEPPSGTRDFLADDVRRRRAAFNAVAETFERYGFDPLETPAFERIEVLSGKYGEDASQLIFKILRRGVHEASGEADLALRYDHTVPLARVIGTHGSRLPSPYKRYVIGPVWRADRAARGRFREFAQCDLDTVGSSSPLADAEIVWALCDGLTALGVEEFEFEVNSRRALYGLLEAYSVPAQLELPVLGSLDKLDKSSADVVVAEIADRGLPSGAAEALVADIVAPGAGEVRDRLSSTDSGRQGLAEVEQLLDLVKDLPVGRASFVPRMVRGLDYYTGLIFEVSAPGFPGSVASGGRYDGLVASLGGPDTPACGGSIGVERVLALQSAHRTGQPDLDVAVTVLGAEAELARLAAEMRARGLRVGTYLGASGKLARQLKWASDQGARFTLIHGADEQADGVVIVRDMATGAQSVVPLADAAATVQARVTP